MKKLLALFSIFSVMSGLFIALPGALAQADGESLLDATITANKTEYGWNDQINIQFTVVNNQLFDVNLAVSAECFFNVRIVKEGANDTLIEKCIQSMDPPTGIIRGRNLHYSLSMNLESLLDSGAGNYQVVVDNEASSNNLNETFTNVFNSIPVTFFYHGGPVEENLITTTLSLNQTKASWSDTLVATIAIKNTGEEDETLVFNNGCYFDVNIEGTDVNNTTDRFCTEAVEEVTIAAGEQLAWEVPLDLMNMVTMGAGQYTVHVDVNGMVEGQWIQAPQIMSADKNFTLNGTIELSIELDHERYLKTKAVIGTWSLKNNGNLSYTTMLNGCKPQLTLYNADTEAIADELDWKCDEMDYGIEILPGDTYSDKISIYPSLLQTLRPGRYFIEFNLNDNFFANSPTFELFYNSFTDIAGHWAQSYIRELQEMDAVTGYSFGKFHPNQAVTRAEFLKMAYLGLGQEMMDDLKGNAFFDSQPGDWHYTYVENAYRANLVQGYEGNKFHPDQMISRAEAMTLLMKMEGLAGGSSQAGNNPFSDVGVRDWFASNVIQAYELGVIEGYGNGQFGPHKPLTRAEAAKLISKMRAI